MEDFKDIIRTNTEYVDSTMKVLEEFSSALERIQPYPLSVRLISSEEECVLDDACNHS